MYGMGWLRWGEGKGDGLVPFLVLVLCLHHDIPKKFDPNFFVCSLSTNLLSIFEGDAETGKAGTRALRSAGMQIKTNLELISVVSLSSARGQKPKREAGSEDRFVAWAMLLLFSAHADVRSAAASHRSEDIPYQTFILIPETEPPSLCE